MVRAVDALVGMDDVDVRAPASRAAPPRREWVRAVAEDVDLQPGVWTKLVWGRAAPFVVCRKTALAGGNVAGCWDRYGFVDGQELAGRGEQLRAFVTASTLRPPSGRPAEDAGVTAEGGGLSFRQSGRWAVDRLDSWGG